MRVHPRYAQCETTGNNVGKPVGIGICLQQSQKFAVCSNGGQKLSEMISRADGNVNSVQGRWDYLMSLVVSAKRSYGDLPTAQALKKGMLFCVNGLKFRSELERLRSLFDCDELSEVLTLLPTIEEKLFKPYLNTEWDIETRLSCIKDHFHSIREIFGSQARYIYREEGFQLFEFSNYDDEPFTIELFPGYLREGSIGLRLCNADGHEVYAISFHISTKAQRTLYIGAVQGPNERIKDRRKEIVKLTRSNHGLRPKALMVEVMYMIAKRLDVDKIYAISNKQRISPTSFFSKGRSIENTLRRGSVMERASCQAFGLRLL